MSSDPTSRTGRCLCGAVTYEMTGAPVATAVCHCEHCQRQSGGAFSVSELAQTDGVVAVNGGVVAGQPGEDLLRGLAPHEGLRVLVPAFDRP